MSKIVAKVVSVVLCVLSTAVSGRVAGAEKTHDWSALAGGGVWVHPELGGHGIGLFAYELSGLSRSARLTAELNTDTIRVGLDRLSFFDRSLELGAAAVFEAGFAGLLPDYYVDGANDPSRGFWASYGSAFVFAKLNLPLHNHVSVRAGARRWLFSRTDETHDALVLPEDAWVFEPKVSYAFWWIQGDPSLSDRHRLFYRIRGLALGVDLALDLRSDAREWGALDSSVFTPPDPRNPGDKTVLYARQWLRAGLQLHRLLRVQLAQFAAVGKGEDDLTRVRLGGMNPYVVPIAGLPWAAVLADRFAAAEASLHLKTWRELEVGALFDAAFAKDIHRLGDSELGWLFGVGLFADWRLGPVQIDLRGGWSPTYQEASDKGHFALFMAVGYGPG